MDPSYSLFWSLGGFSQKSLMAWIPEVKGGRSIAARFVLVMSDIATAFPSMSTSMR